MQKKINKIRQFAFFKPTNDCWAPNFNGNLMECRGFVQESVFENKKTYWSKITLSGNDDYSLEKEIHGTRMECIDFCNHWFSILNKMSIVNQQDMKNLGFSHL